MWGAAKILLLLSTVHLVASRLHQRKGLAAVPHIICPEGQYNYKGVGFCFNCTSCAEFLYEAEKCSMTANTVCAWCGREPNWAEVSDEVLMAYQTKCMMSRLDFVDMTKLSDELADDDDSSEEIDPNEINSVVETVDTVKERSEKNEDDSYDSFEDEEENPTDYVDFKSAEEQEQMEDMEYIMNLPFGLAKRKNNAQEIPRTLKEEIDEALETEKFETDDEDGEYTPAELAEYYKKVADAVEKKLSKKKTVNVKKVTLEEDDVIRDKLPVKSIVLSKAAVESSQNDLVELVPVQSDDSSDDDSNERDIKWDSWLDDKVKLRENTEVVEAEEIVGQNDKRTVYRIVNYDPVNGMETIEVDELPEYLMELQRREQEQNRYLYVRMALKIIIVFIGIGFIINIIRLAVRRNPAHREFTGVPTDCPDYQMIIDASRYLEQQQEKNNKDKYANEHVHENPVFDI